jgi:hypothetical protein
MQGDNGNFRLNPDWEEIATQKNVLAMANALYADVKKYFYDGKYIPLEDVNELVDLVKEVLKSDYNWTEEQIEDLKNTFDDLNKYYPKNIQDIEIIPEGLRNILQQIQGRGIVAFPVVGGDTSSQPAPIHVEFKRKRKRKKSRKIEFVWYSIKAFFRVVIYWLAILGLLTLLGL